MTAWPNGLEDQAEVRRDDQLRELVRSSPPLMRALAVVRESGLADAWIGAGVLRDLVWGSRYGHGFDLRTVRDVDVAFFDPADLNRDNDQEATARLAVLETGLPWEAKNQAAVHTWYPQRFGGPPVPPFQSIAEAVATWPEYATAVAIQLGPDDHILVCAPHGLYDLLDGVWRRNPTRVSEHTSQQRLARHRPAQRWPGVRVISNPQRGGEQRLPSCSSPTAPVALPILVRVSRLALVVTVGRRRCHVAPWKRPSAASHRRQNGRAQQP
ncbi:nucleotidyltransferase family protein [Micromonospora sp. NPDC052213]|uniref:nucleotidyltransferase family protein n=1 Tax=Micromonospora sp. NPDC052213 TaxID=3155812 RepID=UPI00343E4EA5